MSPSNKPRLVLLHRHCPRPVRQHHMAMRTQPIWSTHLKPWEQQAWGLVQWQVHRICAWLYPQQAKRRRGTSLLRTILRNFRQPDEALGTSQPTTWAHLLQLASLRPLNRTHIPLPSRSHRKLVSFLCRATKRRVTRRPMGSEVVCNKDLGAHWSRDERAKPGFNHTSYALLHERVRHPPIVFSCCHPLFASMHLQLIRCTISITTPTGRRSSGHNALPA
jgi:hypothetical protein